MLERIYWLYCRLKCNAFPSFHRYAEKYEVSRATFKRDLVYLRERLNAPVSFDADRQGYYLTDASFELPAFWFDPVHLLMMLGVCRQLSSLSDSSEVRRFQERIESLLTIHYGSGVPDLVSYESVQWTGCDARLLENLIRAIRGRHLVRMTYFAAHSGEVTDRRLEPYRLHHYRGTWHLVGYCHYRAGFSGASRPGLIEAVFSLIPPPPTQCFPGLPAPASLKQVVERAGVADRFQFSGASRPGLIEAPLWINRTEAKPDRFSGASRPGLIEAGCSCREHSPLLYRIK
jgi:hypothetical protein